MKRIKSFKIFENESEFDKESYQAVLEDIKYDMIEILRDLRDEEGWVHADVGTGHVTYENGGAIIIHLSKSSRNQRIVDKFSITNVSEVIRIEDMISGMFSDYTVEYKMTEHIRIGATKTTKINGYQEMVEWETKKNNARYPIYMGLEEAFILYKIPISELAKLVDGVNESHISDGVSMSVDIKSNVSDRLMNFVDDGYKYKMYSENHFKYVIEMWKDTGGFRRFAQGVDIESDRVEDIKELIAYLETEYDRVEMAVHTSVRSGMHAMIYGKTHKYRTRRNLEEVTELKDVKTICINVMNGEEPKPRWS